MTLQRTTTSIDRNRYTAVAIVLHWAIAAAILGNVLLGWWMGRAIDDADTQLRAITGFQLHKSLGLTVLALSLVRLAWRLLHPPPSLPQAIPAWQRRAAATTHWLFYLLMVGIPFTGWVLVSAQWRDGAALNVPTLWFGWFEIPHLFGLPDATDEVRSAAARGAGRAHEWLAWGAVGLLVLHVGAALKHHFVDRDGVLRSMLPSFHQAEPGRRILFGSAALIVLGTAIAMGAGLFGTPMGTIAFREVDPAQVPAAPAASDPASTGKWVFDPAQGRVRFSAEHAGSSFSGAFARWHATLQFDPDDVGGSSFEAEIDAASVTTGNSLYDEALPAPEWFDVARHPLSRYRSTGFTSVSEGRYTVTGVLTIKNRDIPVRLGLAFDGDEVQVSGRFEIDRIEADLGLESDPKAELVSRIVEVDVRATGRAAN